VLDNRILSDVRGTITIDTITGETEEPCGRSKDIGESIKSCGNVNREMSAMGGRKNSKGERIDREFAKLVSSEFRRVHATNVHASAHSGATRQY